MVVDSPLGSMSFPAIGGWLVYNTRHDFFPVK